ncbi:hypothetical protein ACIRPX_16030 [Streptomyces sp. NPDC101225]|uniref:hypothetical protein n=1 Tax=Streptomyces sp. NPDC101225 TaxID=3366135 RepID=UPI00382DD225
MDTYRAANAGCTGRYRRPGAQETHCGRDTLGCLSVPARLCRACVKAEARDSAEATAP